MPYTHAFLTKQFYIYCILFLLIVGFNLASLGLAHATIVFGTITTEPAVPVPGEAFNVKLYMDDPLETPIEDAWLLAEFRHDGEANAEPLTSVRFNETSPGNYQAELTLPTAGDYVVFLRDQTYRQEEATASVILSLNGEAFEPIDFLFPPTAVGNSNLTRILILAIGIPVLVGIAVTVVVLLTTKSEEQETET